jgi:hypothetical protein
MGAALARRAEARTDDAMMVVDFMVDVPGNGSRSIGWCCCVLGLKCCSGCEEGGGRDDGCGIVLLR